MSVVILQMGLFKRGCQLIKQDQAQLIGSFKMVLVCKTSKNNHRKSKNGLNKKGDL